MRRLESYSIRALILLSSALLISCSQGRPHPTGEPVNKPATLPVSQETSIRPTSKSAYPIMPRVQPIALEHMNAQQKTAIGIIDGQPVPKRAQSNLFQTLMHHPELSATYFPLGDRVNAAAEIPDKDRELIILRTAWLYQGRYEWSQHYAKAVKSGWSADDIKRIKLGAQADGWTPFERTLIQATDQLVQNAFLEDATWSALRETYSVQDIMAMITMITHYHWVAMMTKSLGIQPQKDVIDFESGEAPTHDPKLSKRSSVVFLEGPAWRSDGVLFFTDIPNNKIMRWKAGGPARIHRTPSNEANGLIFDKEDRMIIAETQGGIVREGLDGKVETLAGTYKGQKFNAPNDLTIDRAGRIYFTDTRYRNLKNATLKDSQGSIINAVYRIDDNKELTQVLSESVTAPNGILVSPNDEYLYISDNDSRSGGKRLLVRFTLDKDGNAEPQSKKVLFDWGTDRGPDGMAIDIEGNIYVTAGLNHPMPNRTSLTYKAGIYVFKADGTLTNFIPVPIDSVSNVTFGGPNYDTLYITAGHNIWTYDIGIEGYRAFK